MAFTQFPHQQYFRSLNTDTNTRMGYFNLQDGTELKNMMLTIIQIGTIATPYTLRMNIYGNDTLASPIITSDWAIISQTTLEPTPTGYWIGNIYLDFQGNPLNPNVDYYMTAETSGYTRVGDSFYLGINLDWYSPVNTQLSATQAGARFRILGKR
jgi:hypothetical protein